MRRTPLRTRTPLKRLDWFPRSSQPMRKSQLKRSGSIRGGKFTEIPEGVRKEVYGRSGGSCERCHVARADHMHHKLMRSQGGKHETTNLAHLCAACHNAVHAAPAQAYEDGYLIRGNRSTKGDPE